MTTYPIDNCLAIQDGKTIITNPKDFHHVDKITHHYGKETACRPKKATGRTILVSPQLRGSEQKYSPLQLPLTTPLQTTRWSGKVYSVLDLSQGFFSAASNRPTRSYSLFNSRCRIICVCKIPQGMNSSRADFQRFLDFALKGINLMYT